MKHFIFGALASALCSVLVALGIVFGSRALSAVAWRIHPRQVRSF